MPEENSMNNAAACWEANAATWTRQARAGYDIYRDVLNTPAFLAMLPPIAGLDGMDVGCGEGTNTRRLAKLGARMRAVDFAPTFIRHARETEAAEPLGVEYTVADALSLPFADSTFDFATAFMSLMDMADPQAALSEMARVVRTGGFVQFSILHPCFAPPHRKVLRDDHDHVRAIEVADYFATGHHAESWWFGRVTPEERARVEPFRVPYTHLTLAQWVDCVNAAGLRLRRLGEPMASDEMIAEAPEVADTRVAPLFLHVQAIKS